MFHSTVDWWTMGCLGVKIVHFRVCLPGAPEPEAWTPTQGGKEAVAGSAPFVTHTCFSQNKMHRVYATRRGRGGGDKVEQT